MLNGEEDVEVAKDPWSSNFLGLYKHGLQDLVHDEFILYDSNKLRNVENEIARTEALGQDESLKTFAKENKNIIENLMYIDKRHQALC